MKIFFYLAPCLVACAPVTSESALATPYQPMKWDGGYSNFRMGSGRWHVEIRGNAITSESTVSGYFYRRSMELCDADGFGGFQVATGDPSRSTQGPSRYVATSAYGVVTAREIQGETRYQAVGDIICTEPRTVQQTAPREERLQPPNAVPNPAQ